MLNHLTHTLTLVRQKLTDLRELETIIERVLGTSPDAAPAAVETIAPTAAVVNRTPARARAAKPKATPAPKASPARTARGSVILSRVPAIAALREPFGTAQITEALRIDQKTASNIIVGMNIKGWLTKVGFGQYNRSPKFPKPDITAARSDVTAQSRSLLETIHRDIATTTGSNGH
jgi:hypothetical protein